MRLVHAGPLWRDEAAAFHLATSPTLGEVVAKHESFPPPFFFIVRAWAAALGGSDGSLRLWGTLVGLTTLAVLWWSIRRTGGTVPLVALALVAMNASVLLYGDSVRGYGLGTVAILCAFAAFARLAARPDRRAVIGALIAAVLSVQMLFINAVLLLALGLAAIGVGVLRRRPRVVLAVLGVGAAAALSLLPWAGAVMATRSWSMLLHVPVGPGEIFSEMARTASAPVETLQWVWLVLIALALLPGRSPAAGNDESGNERMRADARLFSLFAFPVAILAQWGFLEILRYTPRAWYFLPLLALTAAALDVRLAASPFLRTLRLAIAGLAVLAAALPVLDLARVRMTNVDLVAQRVAAVPGDLVVVNPWYIGISFLRYHSGATPWVTVPDLADHRIHRFDQVKARMTQTDALADVLGAVERTLRSGHRVWVVGDFTVPPAGEPAPVLPPAPVPPFGWREAPYSYAWSLQLGAFLRDHAAQGGQIPVTWNGPINGFERLRLLTFSGWR
jgi:uncharacterized membrane protein